MRLVLTLLIWILGIAPAFAADLAVTGVRLGENEGTTRFVLDLTEPALFQIVSLPNPYRVSITLPALQWRLLQQVGEGRGLVQKFRFGTFEGGSFRVVLDLKAPVQITAAQILPPLQPGGPHRLAVDLRAVPAQRFKPQQLGQYKIQPAVKAEPKLDAQKPVVPATQHIVVIDPGHGGVDPGAIGRRNTFEKNITLKSALALKQALQERGYKVELTRGSDVFIKLQDRVRFARTVKADLFISLHADHHNRAEVRGASVYMLSEQASDAESARLAEQENKADIIAGYDLSDARDAVSSILIGLAQQETMNLSHFYGNLLVEQLSKAGEVLDSPLRSAGFAVLKAPDIPSVLIEMGYLSNPGDEASLNRPEYRARLVNAIADAVDAYFEKRD